MSQYLEDQVAFWKKQALDLRQRAKPIVESELMKELAEFKTKCNDLERRVKRMVEEGVSVISPKIVIKYADRLYVTAKAYAEIPKDRKFITGEESNACSQLTRQLSDWEFMRRNHWNDVPWEKDPYLGLF